MSDSTRSDRAPAAASTFSTLDRRSFLGLAGGAAAAAGAVVATGVVVAGCQDGSTAASPVPGVAGEAAKPVAPDELAVAPVRRAIVPDDVAPAFTFQPIGRRTP